MAKKFDEGGVIRDAQGRFVRWAGSGESYTKETVRAGGLKPTTRKTSRTKGNEPVYSETVKAGGLKPTRRTRKTVRKGNEPYMVHTIKSRR